MAAEAVGAVAEEVAVVAAAVDVAKLFLSTDDDDNTTGMFARTRGALHLLISGSARPHEGGGIFL